MDQGKRINFILKQAEELKKEETPVSATADKKDFTEDKSETETVPNPKDPQPSKQEASSEKSAALSAKDKALELAERAGRPTGTGIAAGAGTGAILATLGMLTRMNNDGTKENSLLTNPALLGLAGVAAGYAGGNLLGSSTPSERKGRIDSTLPGIATTLGALGMSGALSNMDRKIQEANAEKEFNAINRELMTKKKKKAPVTEYDHKRFVKARQEYKKVLERQGLADEVEGLLGKGVKPDKAKTVAKIKLQRSVLNPMNHLRAINPLKELDGAVTSGLNLIARQLKSILGTGRFSPQATGGTVKGVAKELLNTRHMKGRLAALALLTGAGALGVNALRNIGAED